MEAASTAFNKILHRGSKDKDGSDHSPERDTKHVSPSLGHSNNASDSTSTSTTKHVAPTVSHETVHKQHELREQKVLDRERHQDHHKTIVQPLHEREVHPEAHYQEQAGVQHRNIVRDGGGDAEAQAMLQQKQAQFRDQRQEVGTHEQKVVREPTLASEHVHHHLHETVQPVIQKETIMPSVTHKKVPIKEHIQEPTLNEGVTMNKPISVEEFEGRLRK